MSGGPLPKEFLDVLKAVTARRPRAVIDHILAHGSVTSEELQDMGYDHAPRAVRDVRELGIPIKTRRVTGSSGRSIASYSFGEPSDLVAGLTGRTPISKKFKDKLLAKSGPECSVCRHTFESRYLQVDHRVPVEVGGDEPDSERAVEDYMLLDGGCNRAKSWSCEHCPNIVDKQLEVCRTCYWADPVSYEHVATKRQRRVDLVWQGDEEVIAFEALSEAAARSGLDVAEHLKAVLHLSQQRQ